MFVGTFVLTATLNFRQMSLVWISLYRCVLTSYTIEKNEFWIIIYLLFYLVL
jgi:hypothetical protein